ncbi:hypothetical protein [Mycolicibacterium mageritense]|uniref:Uncharacterized protein n=1 Tax=Mycolicibacterium mageritense TaxID=53462 RepID=A0AAI8TS67_MYCME|nr:hypothetical protein [Mycolicibacterium mageritense]TXI65804.1 MAG: hypothetical protein E6Q55_00825 [Mycolicibacterium mageritense]BDY27990.1 hypothetical protein hbim_01920 [Mycolicibacterium mageritense]GJJ21561.1 hypothetical protein MTY414_52340 [Mycolicibacterium mageritense]
MSTPANHAAHLRGALVGACSALTATVAHTVAGGAAPSSSPLVVLVMLCATVGAAVGGFTPEARHTRTALLIGALGAGQALGHVALTMASGHHHTATLSAPMLGLHIAAAVGLGLLIGLAEYLYVVVASVLCWLRIFSAGRIRPPAREVWWPSNVVVARPVLLRAGLGMRAPPVVSTAGD